MVSEDYTSLVTHGMNNSQEPHLVPAGITSVEYEEDLEAKKEEEMLARRKERKESRKKHKKFLITHADISTRCVCLCEAVPGRLFVILAFEGNKNMY